MCTWQRAWTSSYRTATEINDLSCNGGNHLSVGDYLQEGEQLLPAQEVMQVEEDLITPCRPRPDGMCSCPKRELPPPPPTCPTGRSSEQMKRMIINHYAASSFNRCMRQPLPHMKWEPMPINTDPKVKPVAVHRPGPRTSALNGEGEGRSGSRRAPRHYRAHPH